ncbi:bcl-2-modifying factor isoform X2 [Petaurus breviceps papuanus]|uniref:bcl-2-modifying factor isoform X2 n=1 Tax=Petaurus breviceps papuanus TaxID=3040969 RepID=UPI0036DEC6EF
MEPPRYVEELEDDVFHPEDSEPAAQPGGLTSAALFAQSQPDYMLDGLQLFPLTHCCGPGLRSVGQEDKATQTLSPASPSQGVMLPCGPPEEQWEHQTEVQIARKLQCIADQFHRLHMQRHQQNQNHVWWQILLFLHNLALNREENRNGAGPR